MPSMDRRDQIATAAFAFGGLAAGIAMMAVPLLFHVSPEVAWWLFWGGVVVGALALVVGLGALFRRRTSSARPSIDQRITSYKQSGGITARNINFGNGER